MKKSFTILLILSLFAINTYAESYDVSIPSGNNFEVAQFRLWISDDETKIRALLVIVPGYNYDGRNSVNERKWQEFARKNNLAIVACYFKDYENPENWYREVWKGSGQALLDGISEFSLKSDKELNALPIILWGHSAGGQFNYEFACWKPKKVLTFVVNKGGYYHTGIASFNTLITPGIFFIGEDDLYYRNDMIKGIFSVNSRLGALWTLVEEKDTGHEIGMSQTLSIDYFNSIIPIRLSKTNQLLDLTKHACYLGNWETKKAKPFNGQINVNSLNIWLPDSTFATIWEDQQKQ